mmetsp:Transcript_19027/g.33514  ORF Transcript_19027/g.33514 Transcript_19027/m.33514 type:complete len:106 (+) Transcript_19027:1633-1950(+)
MPDDMGLVPFAYAAMNISSSVGSEGAMACVAALLMMREVAIITAAPGVIRESHVKGRNTSPDNILRQQRHCTAVDLVGFHGTPQLTTLGSEQWPDPFPDLALKGK